MTFLLTPARIAFGLCLCYFGVEYIVLGRFPDGLPPAPPWTPGAPFLAYLLGAILLAAGIGLAIRFRAALSALVVAVVCLLCVLLLHSPHLHAILQSGVDRTRAFEPLAISGAAFVLAARLHLSSDTRVAAPRWIDLFGRVIFAFSMIVFGEQHFQYVPFIAPLIPGWIPFHVFFVYFTGAAFVAAGLAIALDRLRQQAAAWLGIMFLAWFLLLHLPRVAVHLRNGDEWNSAIIALVLAAASFAIAAPRGASHLQT